MNSTNNQMPLKINGKNYTAADMNSTNNQMPQKSRCLTILVFGKQPYHRDNLSISLKQSGNHISRRRAYAIIIKLKNFAVLEKHHHILQTEKMKAAPVKANVFSYKIFFCRI